MVHLDPAKPICHIFFDAAGTLFRLREPVGTGYSRLAQPHGLDVAPDLMEAAFRKVWKVMPSPYPSRAADPEWVWWKRLVRQVLEEVSPAHKDAPWFDAYFQSLWTHYGQADTWELFPEVREVLEALSTHCRLGILSNYDARIIPILNGLEIFAHFDPLVSSSAVRASKPDPRIFEAATQLASVAPEQALHVGDEPEADWRGAEAAGLQVWPLDRKQHSLRDLWKALKGVD